ncbi:MAG TPA: hypothetical protein VLI39_12220 [Sedimentisphaerales bacterium]|nr:hypothetical protein [Sedimentisphaerales bacterium]
MKRRDFLRTVAVAMPAISRLKTGDAETRPQGAASTADWLARWEKNILGDGRSRYCDREMGEELGWLVSPFLSGFYYGYMATRDAKWIDMLIDWTESCIRRAVREPDGFIGWPKTGMDAAERFNTDSLLGEAMLLRPIVLMAAEILRTPTIQEEYALKARTYLDLGERIFDKWDSRGCWREVPEGGLWVVPRFGIDPNTGQWTEGYARRATDGFSNPANKENHIARWLIAMHDANGRPVYRERARKWFQLMRSRMKTREDGKYFVWNYWDPAGPWDYKPDGSPKHWIGVHPNGGYYGIDVEAIVTAFEHGLVFTKADIDRLIATNRDFMWNQQVTGARFRRIDGGPPDERWRNSPGALWTALIPYDETLRRVFIANHNPSGWGGLSTTPWFLARQGTPAVDQEGATR